MNLPKRIRLTANGDTVVFNLTTKRSFRYYDTQSKEEEWKKFSIKPDEVFYQSPFGWGVIVNKETGIVMNYDNSPFAGTKIPEAV